MFIVGKSFFNETLSKLNKRKLRVKKGYMWSAQNIIMTLFINSNWIRKYFRIIRHGFKKIVEFSLKGGGSAMDHFSTQKRKET